MEQCRQTLERLINPEVSHPHIHRQATPIACDHSSSPGFPRHAQFAINYREHHHLARHVKRTLDFFKVVFQR
jgi:hypothetical protein